MPFDVSDNGHTGYVLAAAWNTTDSGLASAVHRAGRRRKRPGQRRDLGR